MTVESVNSSVDLTWLQKLFTFPEHDQGLYRFLGPVVAGGLGVLLVWKMLNRRKWKHRQEWDSVGKDVVLLHQFVRGKYCPNLSPFALKVETFLRLANIKYEVDTKTPFGPKGKCPWVSINGDDLTDSEFVIDDLSSRFGVSLDGHLDTQRAAILEAVRIMADEHLFWCVVTWRYWLDKCHTFLTTQQLGTVTTFMFPRFMVSGIKKKAQQQGIGHHTPHEIYLICRKSCATFAGVLGSDDFFGGNDPCRADCAVFGQLTQLMWNAPGTRYEALLTDVYPSLAQYCLRMKERVYPDWMQLLINHTQQ